MWRAERGRKVNFRTRETHCWVSSWSKVVARSAVGFAASTDRSRRQLGRAHDYLFPPCTTSSFLAIVNFASSYSLHPCVGPTLPACMHTSCRKRVPQTAKVAHGIVWNLFLPVSISGWALWPA
ncbi:hypothetical protein HBI56_171920 [Parastagonospora nodorum]|uniref:Uncharacterized protein n=1 Tax=Phaeosphaeria nodorum (strain SN15 / ATCC MYA-4574 / FGSC 10173) TaxID=321614 RepID=A0A7U2HYZ8_PHANO|nr:hypothetical protein HBH56_220650 [Parastagonospora nodorum]QRC97110.1 hypothetical protein JI435_410130 [Parastagonospora nodorum SN15]KAH3924162.1 hypothetical protein HBH54_201080 [Parastagonospora nodorum]KAH3944471.1 hypothetical protein HBH53_157450 [Parastagonospora nodorum]KAH4046227.1 hypothetical protein HBH49_187280 [Parastagonospora nodorum]